MKLLGMISAGLMLAASVVPVAAQAQQRERVVKRTVVHTERHRSYHRPRTRRVCTVRYRNHHRVRVCRTVRY